MTEKVNVSPKMLKDVKDAVELIYEITQEEYREGFKKEGKLFSRVAAELVKRGSLIKTGDRRWATFKWNPVAMKPTKLFIASVAEKLAEERRAWNKNHRERTKAKNNPDMNQIETEREKQEAGVVLDTPSLAQYTIQELWDEIKRRGGDIKNNRLAIVSYID